MPGTRSETVYTPVGRGRLTARETGVLVDDGYLCVWNGGSARIRDNSGDRTEGRLCLRGLNAEQRKENDVQVPPGRTGATKRS